VHRLRGELEAAEKAYREASRSGWEPQPGLALLRLAQGRGDDAVAAIRRVLAEPADRLQRARLLPACVELALAAGDTDEARRGCAELHEIAEAQGSEAMKAMAARARGELALAEDDAPGALASLRDAARRWQELEAPYEAARARVLLGLACRALGDEDTASLELEAARGVFEQLGAAPDLARVDRLTRSSPAADVYGLTRRELQVLRLVADGATNRAIAAELVLSERTVDRHVSNILAKLGVPSRAAATAFAYEHGLL
jgi:DNA-binding CsgD family transcriptional regulator